MRDDGAMARRSWRIEDPEQLGFLFAGYEPLGEEPVSCACERLNWVEMESPQGLKQDWHFCGTAEKLGGPGVVQTVTPGLYDNLKVLAEQHEGGPVALLCQDEDATSGS